MKHTYFYTGTVVNVYDGDSLRANIDLGFNLSLSNEKLVLKGLDAPEISGEERSMGLEAKKFVTDRIPAGTKIKIITEKAPNSKYGRYVATILYGEDDTNLNEELIKAGVAELNG